MFFSNLYVPPARAPEGSGKEVEQLLDTPPIEILPMAQRSEARDSVEDWTGITSTAVRRKLQNRLNQRASRKRKATAPLVSTGPQNTQESTDDTMSLVNIPIRAMGRPQSRKMIDTMVASASSFAALLTPLPSDQRLITLLQFNLVRALHQNISLLGLSVDEMDSDIPSPFLCKTGRQKLVHLPPTLRPTSLQLTVPHHPDIDVFPFAKCRDNFILEGTNIDDFEFCVDLLYGVDWNDSAVSRSGLNRTGMIVWSDPWLQTSWEVEEGFAIKWRKLFKGCQGLLESSNYWRVSRGEPPLMMECFD